MQNVAKARRWLTGEAMMYNLSKWQAAWASSNVILGLIIWKKGKWHMNEIHKWYKPVSYKCVWEEEIVQRSREVTRIRRQRPREAPLGNMQEILRTDAVCWAGQLENVSKGLQTAYALLYTHCCTVYTFRVKICNLLIWFFI